MKKVIIIVCSEDVPVEHLLNTQDWETYRALGEDPVFTMIRKEKVKELETINE